jgi:hypothetical protein
MPASEGCNPGKGRERGCVLKERRIGVDRIWGAVCADMRRSFRTRGRVGRCPQGLHPGLVCAAPLGRVSRNG